jgi:TonB-dependent SusC/RagA subfamily outer membrane receptor
MNLRIILILFSAVFACSTGTSQKSNKKITISGVVSDINKNPVAGAMVLIDNNNTNVVTNNKGSFKIKVNPGAQLITIFSPGNGTAEALINGTTTYYITLDRTSTPPSGIFNVTNTPETVNVGYGSMEKEHLSTPVSKLDMKNSKFDSYTNIYDMLKGRLPGVQVSGNKVTIQGASSFLLSTDPLFIVDGMEVNSIDNIAPSQVESVEVLKGPSASVYGSRGANGVILITLKGSGNNRKK